VRALGTYIVVIIAAVDNIFIVTKFQQTSRHGEEVDIISIKTVSESKRTDLFGSIWFTFARLRNMTRGCRLSND